MEAPWFCEEMIFITKFKAKQSMLAVLEEDHIADFLVYILCAKFAENKVFVWTMCRCVVVVQDLVHS